MKWNFKKNYILSSLLSRVQSGILERKLPISGFDIHGGLGGGVLEGGGMLGG